MKKYLLGVFIFVLNLNNKVFKMFKNCKWIIGVCIFDNNICQALVEGLDWLILIVFFKSDDEILEYFIDLIDIYEDFGKQVDLVIDGGIGKNQFFIVVDCMGVEFVVLCLGIGVLEFQQFYLL